MNHPPPPPSPHIDIYLIKLQGSSIQSTKVDVEWWALNGMLSARLTRTSWECGTITSRHNTGRNPITATSAWYTCKYSRTHTICPHKCMHMHTQNTYTHARTHTQHIPKGCLDKLVLELLHLPRSLQTHVKSSGNVHVCISMLAGRRDCVKFESETLFIQAIHKDRRYSKRPSALFKTLSDQTNYTPIPYIHVHTIFAEQNFS